MWLLVFTSALPPLAPPRSPPSAVHALRLYTRTYIFCCAGRRASVHKFIYFIITIMFYAYMYTYTVHTCARVIYIYYFFLLFSFPSLIYSYQQHKYREQ